MRGEPQSAPADNRPNGASRPAVEAPATLMQSQSTYSELSQASSSGSMTVPLVSELDSKASFRALPLLATDLPQTAIEVCNSTIRPNDRGKEVLSFTIAVQPGRGKEPWRVEKLYSDVLTLDAREDHLVARRARYSAHDAMLPVLSDRDNEGE